MKTMLQVLGVAGIIAASNALVVEYSDNAFKRNNAPYTGPMTAVAINSDRNFKFHLEKDNLFKQDVFLKPDELPKSAHGDGHRICGNNLGVEIAGFGTFCQPSFFHVGIKSSKGKSEDKKTLTSKDKTQYGEFLHFTVHFKSANANECLLVVPIYKIPSEVDSSDPDKLKKWANQNEVRLLSPNDIRKLKAVSAKHGLTTDFKWLSDVLKYGVFKVIHSDLLYQPTDNAPVFISRPIVLSEKDVHVLKAWITAAH